MTDILGVILCGGKASRLGGAPKHSLKLGNMTFLQIAENVLATELSDLALSVKHTKPFETVSQHILIPDRLDCSVAGAILSSLAFAKENQFSAILTIPVDTPLLPQSFARQIISTSHETNPLSPVCVTSEGNIHGIHALWPTAYLGHLSDLITTQGVRRISELHEQIGSQNLDFGPDSDVSFLNVNTPEIYEKVKQTVTPEYHEPPFI